MKIHAFEAVVGRQRQSLPRDDFFNLVQSPETSCSGLVIRKPAEVGQQARQISDLELPGNLQPQVIIHRPVDGGVDAPHRLERAAAKKRRRLHDEIAVIKKAMLTVRLDVNALADQASLDIN